MAATPAHASASNLSQCGLLAVQATQSLPAGKANVCSSSTLMVLTASLPCRQHKQNLGSGLATLAETLQHSDDEWVRIMAAAAGQYSGPLTLAAVEELSAPVSHAALQLCEAACLPSAQLQGKCSGPLPW